MTSETQTQARNEPAERLRETFTQMAAMYPETYNRMRDDLDAALREQTRITVDDEGLTFERFARVNRERCEAADGFGHPLSGWSLSDWFLATMGEFGEAANKAKKLNRVRDGIPGNTETPEELRQGLADEIADATIYLDLLAQSAGLDLGTIIADKFDRTSERIGSPARLAALPHDSTPGEER